MTLNESEPGTQFEAGVQSSPLHFEATLSSLTDREREILSMIVCGRSNPEIASELFLSVNTVKFHVANMLRKLRVRSRVEAAVFASRRLA